jgi:hypothetical protein
VTTQTAPRSAPFYARSPFYFLGAFLVVVAGFFPSYFAKLGTTDAVHHFHGITATLWMLLLIGQSWLARVRKISLHRVFGKISLLLAPLFVISGIMIVRVMLAKSDGFSRAFGLRLAFVDAVNLLGFALAYVLAIYHRRDVALHARFMAATAILALPPALVRLIANMVPGITSFEAAFHGGYLVTELVVAVLIYDDYKTGKVRAPYLALLAILILQQVGFGLIR